jgi:hypothetical protein
MLEGSKSLQSLSSSHPYLFSSDPKVISEEELLKRIRKEKRLYRLLSLLEMETLKLVQLDSCLAFHSEDEYL